MKDFKSTGFVLLRLECPENKMSMLKKNNYYKNLDVYDKKRNFLV